MVELTNVSKYFYPNSSIFRILVSEFLRLKKNDDGFCALRDISITISKGETVGIVGLNGAGKSSLLQLVAGTMKPTKGRVKCTGKVSAILELGSGFNPNFTGVENIFLNASLYGFSRKDIYLILDQIIDFSGIGEHIHLPVSTYSSGMIVRLAYSIITQLKPDILIIDEALAVGDFTFQQKCVQSMRNLQQNGSTILFVSHSLELINEFCSKILILEKGKLSFFGHSKEGSHLYMEKLLEEKEKQNDLIPQDKRKNFKINSLVHLESCLVSNQNSKRIAFVDILSPIKIEISLIVKESFDDLHCGFNILDNYGRVSFGTTTYALGYKCGQISKNQKVMFSFNVNQRLASGKYSITLGFANGAFGYPESKFVNSIGYFENAYVFEVLQSEKTGKWSGPVLMDTKVESYLGKV